MNSILTRIQEAYISGNIATLYCLMPELMDAIGVTIFEIPITKNDKESEN